VNRLDAKCFLGALCASAVTPIFDLRLLISALCALFFALCLPVEAQQPTKIPRIGYLAGGASSVPAAFVKGLRDLGYYEGKNIVIEFRTTEGKSGRSSDLAAELIRLKMDILVTEGTGSTLAAKKLTSTIPIVMTGATDAVATGLVDSLARPGGNVTGLTSITGELGGKLIELLKEIIPRLSRVVVPGPPPAGSPSEVLFMKETEIPARALKVQLISFPVRGPEDYEGIFRAASKEQANALLVRIPVRAPLAHRRRFVELAAKNRLPAIYTSSNWMEAGGLISYGADPLDRYSRLAMYVDKILKGAKPADLPVEAPKDFELVINLKTAKQIGLTIPPNVLARADRVIQ
jgi:putative ABC transport system substrate-binding protein